jgi:chromosome segregation ATPase
MPASSPEREVRAANTATNPSSPTPPAQDSSDRQKRFEAQLRNELVQKQKERTEAGQQTKGLNAWDKKAEKLDEAKKKVCEKRINTINRLKEKMDQRRQNVLNRITKISEATQTFYTDKQLIVTNYDELMAKVAAAKVVAESAVQSQQQIPSLDCNGEHPRAEVSEFKERHSTAIDAIKAYRDAVKELVRAVKAAVEMVSQEVTTSTSPSPTTNTEGGVQ